MQTITSNNQKQTKQIMNTFQIPQLTLSANQMRQIYVPFGKELIQWMKAEQKEDGTFNCNAEEVLNKFIDDICCSNNKIIKKASKKKSTGKKKTSTAVSDTDDEVDEAPAKRGRPKKEVVDNSVAEFTGQAIEEKPKKKKNTKAKKWMAPKRLLPKGKKEKDDDAIIKQEKSQGLEGKGISYRGLNDKPLRYKINK